MTRPADPSDVRDAEGALVAPYLPRMTADAPQREHSLRAVFHGRRWLVRAGAAWRMMPHALPPGPTVYQQRQRWLTGREQLTALCGQPSPCVAMPHTRALARAGVEAGARRTLRMRYSAAMVALGPAVRPLRPLVA